MEAGELPISVCPCAEMRQSLIVSARTQAVECVIGSEPTLNDTSGESPRVDGRYRPWRWREHRMGVDPIRFANVS